MISKKEIIKAWVTIRKIDCSIPDEVLDFMKNASIEALTSRSCMGCKHFKEHDRYQAGICEKGHADSTRGGLYTVDYDFCCNRYAPKEQ